MDNEQKYVAPIEKEVPMVKNKEKEVNRIHSAEMSIGEKIYQKISRDI